MAEEDCRGQVNACAMRLARLDPSGVPLPGAENMLVTDDLVTLNWTSVYTDADEIDEKNACGTTSVNFLGEDTFKRGDIAVVLVRPNPYVQEFLSGGDLLTVVGRPKGFAAPPLGPVSSAAISIELWAYRVDDGDLDPAFPYAHYVYPKVKNLRMGDHVHGNEAIKPAFTGRAYENINWYDGPVGDWPATSDRVVQWLPAATIPTPTCGYLQLNAS